MELNLYNETENVFKFGPYCVTLRIRDQTKEPMCDDNEVQFLHCGKPVKK